LFLVNLREVVQFFFGHTCEWEFRPDVGEEEHGINPAKRYCKICGKCQHAYYHRFGDVRVTWKDEVLPEDVKLP
jgi:hypothetical protein